MNSQARDTNGGSPPSNGSLQSVARAIGVLRALAERPRRPAELVKDLHLSWATLHRTLAQLEAEGLVERDDAGACRIGIAMWTLGSSYLIGLPLAEVGTPYVRRASEEIRDVAFQLCIRSGDTAAVIAAEQQSGDLITKAAYGFRFPLHCGSKGMVLLAYLPDAERELYLSRPLARMTDRSVTDPAVLRVRLAAIRETGIALTVADVQSFTASVACPVRDRSGRVIASFTGITSARFMDGGSLQERLSETVQSTAAVISAALGWHSSVSPSVSVPTR